MDRLVCVSIIYIFFWGGGGYRFWDGLNWGGGDRFGYLVVDRFRYI